MSYAAGPTFNQDLYPVYNDPFASESIQAADKRARRRFIRALLSAFAIYFLLGLLLGTIGQDNGWSLTPRQFQGPESRWFAHCVHKDKMSFDLNIEHELSFIARGAYSGGKVEFVQSDRDQIHVTVTPKYNDNGYLLSQSKICTLRDRKGTGIGIYTPPSSFASFSRLSFDTVFHIPHSISSFHLLNISTENTAVSTSLLPTLAITNFTIESTNSKVVLHSLYSRNVDIAATNSEISGNISIGESLAAQTTNGAITFSVTVDESIRADATDVELATTNGAVNLNYLPPPRSLFARSRPLHSKLSSINGGVHVTHTAFEGDFSLSTAWGKGFVTLPDKSDDKSGWQWKITKDEDSIGNRHEEGTIWWGKQDSSPRQGGNTIVETTLGDASIVFDF